MLPTLDKQRVAERAFEFPREQYRYITGLMKGLTIGAAAVVLVGILNGILSAGQTPDPTLLPRLALWFASFGPLLITHATTERGLLLVDYRFNVFDTVIPIVIGLIEFLLFVILGPVDAEAAASSASLWRWWYVLYGIHALSAAALVYNRRAILGAGGASAVLDTDMTEEFNGWLTHDFWEAGSVGVGAIVVGFLLMNLVPQGHILFLPIHVLTALLAVVVTVRVLRTTGKQWHEVITYLNKP